MLSSSPNQKKELKNRQKRVEQHTHTGQFHNQIMQEHALLGTQWKKWKKNSKLPIKHANQYVGFRECAFAATQAYPTVRKSTIANCTSVDDLNYAGVLVDYESCANLISFN